MGKQSHQGQIYCSVETKSHHQTREREKYDAAGLGGTGAEMIGLHNICLYQSEGEIEERKRRDGEREKKRGEQGRCTARLLHRAPHPFIPVSLLQPLLFSFVFHVVFSFCVPIFPHPDTLLSQVVQSVLAFHPSLLEFLFSLCLFFITLPLHSTHRFRADVLFSP